MNMNPEVVQEIVEKYVKEVENLKECSEKFANADRSFSSWTGPTREKLQNNIKNEMPAFDELIETVRSYGNTAQDSAERTINVENDLTKMLG